MIPDQITNRGGCDQGDGGGWKKGNRYQHTTAWSCGEGSRWNGELVLVLVLGFMLGWQVDVMSPAWLVLAGCLMLTPTADRLRAITVTCF
jgi:hypothetical protein